MATEYHLITQNGTAGSYWAGLTTEQKDRYYWGGSYRVYATMAAWMSAVSSRANYKTALVVECEGAWLDTSSTTIYPVGFYSVTMTTRINGVYGSGFHGGVIGAGYRFQTAGACCRTDNGNFLIDGLEMKSTGAKCILPIGANTVIRNNILSATIDHAIGAYGTGWKGNNNLIHSSLIGIKLVEYSGGLLVSGNTVYGCGTGIQGVNSSVSTIINNVAFNNTTNWGTAPSGGYWNNNAGLIGEAWTSAGATRVVVSSSDFVDAAGGDYRPSGDSGAHTSSSLLVDVASQEFAEMVAVDIAGNTRPSYKNGSSTYWDIGAYEFDWGYGETPNLKNFTITGLVSGSRVKIKKTSDGTSIYNDIVSATSLTISYQAGTANTPVTVDIRKGSAAPYYKPLRTTSSISYLADTEISVAQIEAIAADTYPAQIATDWSINTGTKAITRNSGGQYSMQDLYSWLLDYYDDSSTVDLDMPIEGITPNQFELINSGSISDADMQYLNTGSLWSGTTLWANLTVVGTLAADTTVYVHVDGSEYTGYWGAGNIDVSIKFTSFDGTEEVDVRAHKYTDTYDHWHFDSIGEGLNYAALSTADDPNNQTASGTVAAYGITVTVDNPTDQQIDGVDTPADYTTTVDANGLGVQEVYEYLKYLTREKSAYVSANASYAEVKDAPYGTFAGGIFFGARGIWLENVASGDALNYVLTDNDGVTHQASAPPVQILVTNLVVGERLQIYDMTNDLELANTTATGTSYSLEKTWTGDLDIRLRHIKVSGATATVFQEEFGTFTATGLSMRATQETDVIYNVNGIDGSAVTGITINDTLLLVSVATGSMSLQQIYAYETYWLSTEAGIRDEGRFIDATDVANYVWHEFKLKNTSSPSVPLVITGGYVRDADTSTAIGVLDTSGGTVFFAPDHVVPYAAGAEATVAIVQAGLTAQGYSTARAPKLDNLDIPVSEAGGGSGGLTTDEHNKLMSLSTTNLDVAVSTRSVAADMQVTVNPTLTTDEHNKLMALPAASDVVTAISAAVIPVDTVKIKGQPINGTGIESDPWGP